MLLMLVIVVAARRMLAAVACLPPGDRSCLPEAREWVASSDLSSEAPA